MLGTETSRARGTGAAALDARRRSHATAERVHRRKGTP